MKKFSHWTPRYVIDRLALELFRRKYCETLPRMASGAIQLLDGYLSKTDAVFEYGAGFSTIWFAKRVGSVVSVESDEKWFSLVKERLSGLDNARAFLIRPAAGARPIEYKLRWDPVRRSYAVHVPAGTQPLEHVTWDYVNKIKEYGAHSFDLILNDGYARPLVARIALDYLKKGGLFVWDDFGGYFPVEKTHCPVRMQPGTPLSDDTRYFLERVRDWRRVVFDDGVQTTAVFFSPIGDGPR